MVYCLICLNILSGHGGVRKQVPLHASCAVEWLCATAFMSYCVAHIASLNQETRTIFGINSQIRVVNLCIGCSSLHWISFRRRIWMADKFEKDSLQILKGLVYFRDRIRLSQQHWELRWWFQLLFKRYFVAKRFLRRKRNTTWRILSWEEFGIITADPNQNFTTANCADDLN